MEGIGIAIIVLFVVWGGNFIHQRQYTPEWYKERYDTALKLSQEINGVTCFNWDCQVDIAHKKLELKEVIDEYNRKAVDKRDMLELYDLPLKLEVD